MQRRLMALVAVVLVAAFAPTAPSSAAEVACDGAWTPQNAPKPWVRGEPLYLQAVDAAGPTDAWAVGFEMGEFYYDRTYTMHWDGAAWTRVPSPQGPKKASASLYDVAIAGADDVWAVGSYSTRHSERIMVLHWDGAAWTRTATPLPPGLSYASVVEALSANDVWMGGGSKYDGLDRGFLLHWDGSAWTFASQVAGPPIRDMDVISASDIFGMGYENGNRPLVTRWNGTSWNNVYVPDPAFMGPRGVAGLGGSDAWSVGASLNSATTYHWDGTWWNYVQPFEPGTDANWLSAVDHDPTFGLVAVGGYRGDTSGVLVQRWTGTSWEGLGTREYTAAPSLVGVSLEGKHGFAVGGRKGRPIVLHSCIP